MTEYYAPISKHLRFNSPLSLDRSERLARFVVEDAPARIIDMGCGWGELLLTCLELSPGSQGVGVDNDADVLARARLLASEHGLGNRVEFVEANARYSSAETSAEAAICIGASHIWGPDNAPQLSYSLALQALRHILPVGGRLAYGDGIWSQLPTQEAVDGLGGTREEFVTLGELVDIAIDAGFAPVRVHEASLEEWDAFESGYAARYAEAAVHARDEEARSTALGHLRERNRVYNRGYRGFLGLAYLELQAF